MSQVTLNLLSGWSAILSAVAAVATLVTGVLFFTMGGRFGRINDAASVAQMALTLPVAAAMALLGAPEAVALAVLAAAIGAVGLIVAGVLQALLVLGRVGFEQSFGGVLGAGGLIGLWLILANVAALSAPSWPVGLTALGILSGAAYIVPIVAYLKGGQQHPLLYAGSALALAAYAAWAAWLGGLLLTAALSL